MRRCKRRQNASNSNEVECLGLTSVARATDVSYTLRVRCVGLRPPRAYFDDSCHRSVQWQPEAALHNNSNEVRIPF